MGQMDKIHLPDININGHVLSDGWYDCKGMDGINSFYRLNDKVLTVTDYGQVDEEELMGLAPKAWEVNEREFSGQIIIVSDDNEFNLTFQNNRLVEA